MFGWEATGLEFNDQSTYRTHFGAQGPVPLLGITPTNEVVSIPFFAIPRITQVISGYVSSGAGFSGQNIVTLATGDRSGTFLVGYSIRYRIEVGTNSFAFRVADTTSSASGTALSEAFALPELETRDDLQDYLALDPIHDVDERGWPHMRG